MTIRVRDDDVLIGSSSYDDPLKKFKSVHELICQSDKLMHVPAILLHHVIKDGTPGIIGIPSAVEYVREQTQAGRMKPEIHGLEHVDYGKLDKTTVIEHLKICQEFLWKEFDIKSTRWMTPWGASQPHLHEAASIVGLKLVDCSRVKWTKLAGRHGVVQQLREGRDISYMEGGEIFMHWWEGGLRLNRVVEVLKHGSWDAAKEANGKWFAE